MKFAGRQRRDVGGSGRRKRARGKKPKLNRTIFRNELLMRESINRRSREYGGTGRPPPCTGEGLPPGLRPRALARISRKPAYRRPRFYSFYFFHNIFRSPPTARASFHGGGGGADGGIISILISTKTAFARGGLEWWRPSPGRVSGSHIHVLY